MRILQQRYGLNLSVWFAAAALLATASPLFARDALIGKWKADLTSDDGSKVYSDSITFKGGKFTSEKQADDGYESATYEDEPAPHGMSAKFSVTLTNKAGDSARWSGFSTGNEMDGTLVVTKKDGSTMSFSFKASKG